jgi:Protein of unknown function (DUF3828)
MRRVSQLFLCISALVVAFPVMVSQVRAQEAPDAIVREIYSAYNDGGLGASPTDPQVKALFSGRVQALLDEEDDRIQSEGIGRLDFDVFVDAQDCDVTDVVIAAPKIAGAKASVDVSLLNYGEPRRFQFLFVKEGDDWRIDDIAAVRSDAPWKLTALLKGD